MDTLERFVFVSGDMEKQLRYDANEASIVIFYLSKLFSHTGGRRWLFARHKLEQTIIYFKHEFVKEQVSHCQF